MLRRYFLLAFFLATVSFSIHAETGVALIKERFPQLYYASVATVGEVKTEALFQGWTQDDILQVRLRAGRLFSETVDARGPVSSADRLYVTYGSGVVGTMGEAFGNVLMRKRTEGSSEIFVDEMQYGRLNSDGNKPDGLCYRIEDGRLVITQVLESKMGNASYSSGQAEGYLRRWQNEGKGITVMVGGKSRRFSASEIAVATAEGIRPIREVDEGMLRKVTTLVGTKPESAFGGAYEKLPVGATELRSIVHTTMGKLIEGKNVASKKENFHAPHLTPEEVPDFQEAARDFVMERGDFPRGSGETSLEKYLAKEVRLRGQVTFFMEDLDGPSRHLMTSKGNLPAKFPFEQRLFLTTPDTPGAVSSLRAFVRRYEKHSDPIPIIEQLKARSPQWNEFFKANDPLSFRTADVSEINECLDAISAMGKKIN